jgi:hypothetical protein
MCTPKCYTILTTIAGTLCGKADNRDNLYCDHLGFCDYRIPILTHVASSEPSMERVDCAELEVSDPGRSETGREALCEKMTGSIVHSVGLQRMSHARRFRKQLFALQSLPLVALQALNSLRRWRSLLQLNVQVGLWAVV